MKKLYFIIVTTLLTACQAPVSTTVPTADSTKENPNTQKQEKMSIYPTLLGQIEEIEKAVSEISEERKALLQKFAQLMRQQQEKGQTLKLIFICTHNSRRSHIAQLWAALAAAHYGIAGVATYSGGTEATAFNPRAVAAMQRAGFRIEKTEEGGENPVYQVSFAENSTSRSCFSKKYSHEANPPSGFVAIMVCSDADEGCPIVGGADERIAIPYIDPKVSDNSPEEAVTYDARSRQIATEIFYAFAQLAKLNS